MINVGKITEVVSGSIRKIITETFGGYTKTANQVTTPGIDSAPINGDQGCFLEITDSNGKSIHIGTYNDSSVNPGETKIYSRDPSGTIQFFIHLTATGIKMSDALELNKIELDSSGITFTVAGATYGAATHIHGTPVGPSAPPNPGT